MLLVLAVLASLSLTAESNNITGSCGKCDPSLCGPLPADGCALGTVLDFCGCCSVCAAGQGEACGGRGSSAKRCAPGLECLRTDKGKKTKLGVCICKSPHEVCGSDGVTYKSGCDLKAASLKAESQKKPEIKVLSKGKCAQAPVIVTVPGEIWNLTGSQVYLSCEVTGIPTPVLTWKKISNSTGKAEVLPGDRDNLAIQTRGGPEKHQVTGWVLVSPLTKADGGSYQCLASNHKGETSAMGTIHVVDSVADIPYKKVKDGEL